MSKGYDRGSHCKGMLKVHLIFVTRFRRKILMGQVALDCKHLIEDVCAGKGWTILKMETDRDHIHLLISYQPSVAISTIVKVLKQYTTYFLWEKHAKILKRYYWYQKTFWSKGYFFCSIGDVSSATIERYIQNQG